VLRAVALNRTPGFNFPGYFLELSYDRVAPGTATASLDTGPHNVDATGEMEVGALALLATLLCGGKHEGLFFEPTVLANVRRDMRVFREETFGPVAPIIQARNDDEAVEIANDSDYGLSAGIMTRNEERGLSIAQRLRTGMAHINDCSVNDEPHVPFGGIGASGLGRHGGKPGIDTFTELRWITLERGGRHYPPPLLMNPH
jgi:aldehyde dehydrogenase (NAD+)